MAKSRATFGKLQRERDKKAKAAAKRERRITRGDAEGDTEVEVAPGPEPDQAKILAALESLHRSYDEGNISIDEFEQRRDELTSKIRV